MTLPSSLVLDGSEIKMRLQAHRAVTKTAVHVDWLRFTVYRRNTPAPAIDVLFPPPDTGNAWDEKTRSARLLHEISRVPNCDIDAAAQAHELASEVAEALGPDFTVAHDMRKGHDFYKFRWAITRNDAECGWVGFLSSGNSPRQASQSRTIHCNLFGAACTFAAHGWETRVASIIDDCKADITRCDLALDFFDGIEGGLDSIVADYKEGRCDVGGRRLKCSTIGDWLNGNSRSLYFGTKEGGKQTNAYEKGDQLFGHESGSKWLRVELRYGNKLRVLPVDMLRRPADFFAGASDWHASMLRLADEQVIAEKVKCAGRLAVQTVEAEVTKNLRWAFNTAAPTIAAAFQYMDEEFLNLVTSKKLPQRLQKFAPSELKRAFSDAIHRFTAEGTGHALQPA